MTKITHHLTDALLMAYAAGTLPEGFALVVAAHVSMCDDCRARLQSYEALGGALLDREALAALAPDSLEATLARIAGKAPAIPQPARRSVLPGPLLPYIGGDLDAVRWRPVGGGVRQAILPTSPKARVRLLYIPGGTAVPDHAHGGLELTLVLQGAFCDDGERFGPGDIEVTEEEIEPHSPVAEPGPACICLAATDAPLRFRGLLPRLAQPFLKI